MYSKSKVAGGWEIMGNWSPNPKPPAAQPSCGLVVACQIPILPHQVSRFCSPVSIATSPPQNGSIYGQVEHVRLCCLLCLLYLAESGSSQRAIAQEKAESPGNLWIWGHLGRWKSDSWEIWQSPDSEHPSGCEDVVDGLRKRDPHRSHRECSEGQFFFFWRVKLLSSSLN